MPILQSCYEGRADVLAWPKGQGKGYQTRMNAILREAMLRSLQRKA